MSAPILKTIGKWVILLLLTAYAIFMVIWARAEASRHICSGIDIKIEGAQIADTITRQGIMSELKKYPGKIVGAPYNTINTLGIEKYLKSFSNFEDVQCVMSSQGRLMIKAVPMIPEVRIFDGDKSYYVNKDGKRIESRAEFFTDVPVIQGHFGRKLRATDILPVTRFIRNDSLLHQLVGMVVVKDKNNILLVPRIDGHVINIGDTSDLPEKRRAILTAYHNILPYRGWNMYDTISVKFNGMIVATRRDKTPLHPSTVIEEEADPEESALPQEQLATPASQPDN